MTPVESFNPRLRRAPGKGQQGDVARLLDGSRKPPLMRSADAGQPARNDLSALGDKLRKQSHIFVVDRFDFLDAEFADFFAAEKLAAAFPAAGPSWSARTATLAPALSR